MADINTVPLGQAGTGSAFVLGRSKAADSVIETIDYNRKIAQQNELLKQKQAQQTASDWEKNALKVDGGLYWQPEFKKRYQQHLQDGIELRQLGINPFNYNANDPVQSEAAQNYLLERQSILSDTDTRKATEANVADQFKAFRADPDAYEPESFQELNDYINKPYSQASKGMIPQLRKRFDPIKEIIPKLDPSTYQSSSIVGNNKIEEKTVLEEPTKQNIETLFKSANGGERYLKQSTGLTISEAKKVKDTFDGNKEDLLKRYKGDKGMREAIARDYGITGEGQQLNDLLDQQAEQITLAKQKYNSVINQYYNIAKSKADPYRKVSRDYSDEDQDMQRQRLSMEQQRLNLEKARGTGTGAETYRQDLINRMFNQVPGSGEELKALAAARSDYQKPLGILVAPDGKITLNIPSRQVTSFNQDGEFKAKIIEGRKETFDPNNPADALKLNSVISEISKENISPSKFKTGNAAGKIKKPQSAPQTITKKATFVGIPKGGF